MCCYISRVRANISKLILSIALCLAMPVRAQMILEEVLVVAQKRPQPLQDVPVAVTAFSSEDLDISGVKDVFDPKWLLNPAKVFPLSVTKDRRSGRKAA